MRRCYGCMHEFADEFELCPHCGFIVGTAPEIKSHLPCGTKLSGGRYILGKVLGHGGFGITYIAWDSKRNRPVAIKEFFPNAFSTRCEGESAVSCYNSKSEKFFKEGVKKMLDEGERLSKFYKNENIVNVYDHFEANKTAYIVMEYLEGKDLKKYLAENGGKLDIDEAIEIILPVLNALNDMHKENMIHRDISPDNIFICDNGKVKILDFGSARLAVQDADKSMSIMLKKGYAPKEQYSSRSKQGPWTDVYAVSATLYELVTGHKPSDSNDREDEPIKSFKELGVLGRGELESIIMKGMALDVADRTPDAATLYNQLSEIIKPSGEGKPDLVLKPPKSAEKKKSKKPFIVTAVLAVVIIASAIGGKFAWDKFSVKPEETTTTPTETTTELTSADETAETPLLSEKEIYPFTGTEENQVNSSDDIQTEKTEETVFEKINTILGEQENVYMSDIDGDGNSEIVVCEKSGVNGAREDAVWLYTSRADGNIYRNKLNCGSELTFWADAENKNTLIVEDKTPNENGYRYAVYKFSVSNEGFKSEEQVVFAENELEKENLTVWQIKNEFDSVCKKKFENISVGLNLVDLSTLNFEGACGASAKWIYHQGGKLLRIYGTGLMDSYERDENSAPWKEYKAEIEKIAIGDSIVKIGNYSFSGFGALNDVAVGNSVTEIGKGSFCASALSVLKIPDNVQKIEDNIIEDSSVKEVYIGNGVSEIAENAFFSWNLEKIVVGEKNRHYTSDSVGVLYDEGMTELINYPVANPTEKYTVNESARLIKEGAFANAKNLKEVVVSANVYSIGDKAFSCCEKLSKAVISGAVKNIPAGLFENCAVLGEVKIGDGAEYIGEGAFYNCSFLNKVELPSSVKAIGAEAFYGCASLSSVNLPSSLVSIGAGAFYGCSSISSLTIPSSVTKVAENAFGGFRSSQTIYVDKKKQECSSWENWSGNAHVEYKNSNIFW